MAKSNHKVAIAECPECETTIRFHKPLKIGQIVICPECEERLEVRQLNPLELDWTFDDYDDDYDYDDNWD